MSSKRIKAEASEARKKNEPGEAHDARRAKSNTKGQTHRTVSLNHISLVKEIRANGKNLDRLPSIEGPTTLIRQPHLLNCSVIDLTAPSFESESRQKYLKPKSSEGSGHEPQFGHPRKAREKEVRYLEGLIFWISLKKFISAASLSSEADQSDSSDIQSSSDESSDSSDSESESMSKVIHHWLNQLTWQESLSSSNDEIEYDSEEGSIFIVCV